MLKRLSGGVLIALLAAPAAAQLRLPALPQLPVTSTLQAVPQTLDRAAVARQIDIDRLVRSSRRLVDLDPLGNPVVRNEVLALSPAAAAVSTAESQGFDLDRSQTLALGDMRVAIFKCPPGMSTRAGLDRLRKLDPSGIYDYNHIYLQSGAFGSPSNAADRNDGSLSPGDRPHIRVGLLDTGIDASHPDFNDSSVHSFGCGDKQVPALHGTAVASLIVSRASAELYAADVYCGSATGGAVDTIVAALAWLAQKQVAVINVSLVGPNNALLEQAVTRLTARGYLLVAAVGNDGPTAPPLYPAAYPHVVGVTAVDAKRRVLFEALRGPQVMFAALGADMTAANAVHSHSSVRGTSFAAPCVAALLAQVLTAPDSVAAQDAVDGLARTAIDLGPPGKDLTYGFGFVGAGPR